MPGSFRSAPKRSLGLGTADWEATTNHGEPRLTSPRSCAHAQELVFSFASEDNVARPCLCCDGQSMALRAVLVLFPNFSSWFRACRCRYSSLPRQCLREHMTDFHVPSQLAATLHFTLSHWGPDAHVLSPKSRMYTEGMIQGSQN